MDIDSDPGGGQEVPLSPRTTDERAQTARLTELVYLELKGLARRYMRRERGNHTLQTTALVHEAYIRLQRSQPMRWNGRTHFIAVAASQMRRILVEHARAAGAAKRGSAARRITLQDAMAITPDRQIELLILDEALRTLSGRSPRQASVIELRVFAGLSVVETAAVLQVSERTIKQDWKVARAWLTRQLRLTGEE